MTKLRLEYGSDTHPGRRRRQNEDAVLAEDRVFVVADGAGGHAGGAVAAAETVRIFAGLVGRRDITAALVADTVEAANAHLLKVARAETKLRGMATTLAALVATASGADERWILCTVGDSRIYRFADGRLRQLSTDHTEVNDLVRTGALTAAEAIRYPRRHVLTRALGRIDAHEPVICERPLRPDETFLLCSDGLSSELNDDDIASCLADASTAGEAAQNLVAAAVQAGGRDNVTAVVITLHGLDR